MLEPTTKQPVTNYITPVCLQRLRNELRFLLTRERSAVTQVVAWRQPTAIAARTPTISTANGHYARSTGDSFSHETD